MRLVQETSFERGLNHFSVEAKSEDQLNALCATLDEMGWADRNTQCGEETGYGYSTEYAIDSSDAVVFKAHFKKAKAMVK